MNYTNHYNLNKPELSEQFNLDDWNDNSDAIDTQMFQNETNINTIVSALTTKDVSSADTLYSKLMKLIYPVGSLYWSSNSTNPAQLFGGTWTQIKDKFIWAKGDSDTVNATGGAKTVTLTEPNLPSHSHSFTPQGKIASTSGGTDNKTAGMSANSTGMARFRHISYGTILETTGNMTKSNDGNAANYATVVNDSAYSWKLNLNIAHTHAAYFTGTAGTTGPTGSGTAVNKMPPYIVKYCWERTA